MKKILCVIIAIAFVLSTAGCNKSSSYDSSNNTNSGSLIDSSNSAIWEVKNYIFIKDQIASLYNMEFYYSPEYGACTAKQDSKGDWEVVLKGTISGYTDEYKTDFEYDKKFIVKATVSKYGTVYIKSVSKG